MLCCIVALKRIAFHFACRWYMMMASSCFSSRCTWYCIAFESMIPHSGKPRGFWWRANIWYCVTFKCVVLHSVQICGFQRHTQIMSSSVALLVASYRTRFLVTFCVFDRRAGMQPYVDELLELKSSFEMLNQSVAVPLLPSLSALKQPKFLPDQQDQQRGLQVCATLHRRAEMITPSSPMPRSESGDALPLLCALVTHCLCHACW